MDNARRMLEAQEIASKLDDGEINEWNDGVNAKIEEADVQVEAGPRRMVGETKNRLGNERTRGENAI